MNLDFSDDQKFLQSEAKKFLEKEESVKRSRGVLEGSESFDNDLWQKIIELGWTGIRIPEEYEGLVLPHQGNAHGVSSFPFVRIKSSWALGPRPMPQTRSCRMDSAIRAPPFARSTWERNPSDSNFCRATSKAMAWIWASHSSLSKFSTLRPNHRHQRGSLSTTIS